MDEIDRYEEIDKDKDKLALFVTWIRDETGGQEELSLALFAA